MTQYEVKITDEALNDMEQLYNYISHSLQSPENAIRQYNRISDAIIKLDIFPDRFRIIDSNPEQSKQIRKMQVDNYSVFYVIRKEKVIVINVLYSASDIEKRLKIGNQ